MLRCESLTKTYPSGGRELTVLEVSRSISSPAASSPSSGPSGSGKTTLLGLLAGLDRPDARAASARRPGPLGASSRTSARACAREKIGFVFQSFQLIPTLTARENVLVPLELRGRGRPRARARRAAARVGLGTAATTTPPSSRAASSSASRWRAPSQPAELLFADEPTGNLDAATGAP